MSLSARRELLAATAPRYQEAAKTEKEMMLDEFVTATGYHRKYAITLLNSFDPASSTQTQRKRKPYDRKYDEDVKEALVIAWEAANRICSKRLVPFLPELVGALERYDHLHLDVDVRERLLAISASTVDRLLCHVRHGEGISGLSTTKPGGLLKHMIQIRTFADWDDDRPGFLEADLVAHCGDNVGGHFLCTLVMTDVATGWIEMAALLFRDQETTLQAIERLRMQLPFDMLGLDTDNGTEFLNYLLYHYCEDESITFTRSRPYKKNDQCHVEQKNGSVVRKFVGYDRFEGIQPCRILGMLYEPLRLYVNFFQPSLKLLSKRREGSRVIKKYDTAQTPYQRVVADKTISADSCQALEKQFKRLDPVELLATIERLQDQLWRYAYVGRRVVSTPVSRNRASHSTLAGHTCPHCGSIDAERPTKPFSADKAGSQPGNHEAPEATAAAADAAPGRAERMYRRTKRKRKQVQGKRWWRTREDPFEAVWGQIEQQLEHTPNIHATQLLAWLQVRYPDQFQDGQLRTLQRRVKDWRVEQAARQPEPLDDSGTE
jgi:hypothetical protein